MAKRLILALTLLTLMAGLLAFLVRKEVYRIYVTERLEQRFDPSALVLGAGDTLALEALRGKIVVLDFWATWCAPCRRSLPEFETISMQYAADSSVVFYAVNTSWRNTLDDAVEFMSANHISIPIAYDAGGKLTRLIVRPRGIPTYCILDRQGRLRIRHKGYRPFWENYAADLRDHIETLKAE